MSYIGLLQYSLATHNWDLLPPDELEKTGPVDHADWNYTGLLGAISRIRFRLVEYLLGGRTANRLLEIGYGSGIFLPELKRHARYVFGIDVHSAGSRVANRLTAHYTEAQLCQASASALPFANESFDAIVALSTLEFVGDLESACRELSRVLTTDGVLVVVLPGHSPVVDLGLRALTGADPNKDFSDRRQKVIPTLLDHFARVVMLSVPPVPGLCLYRGLRFRRAQSKPISDW
jgi:ubiquinone/menaquinone biosynthesis C-methylase UbiE